MGLAPVSSSSSLNGPITRNQSQLEGVESSGLGDDLGVPMYLLRVYLAG